MTSGPTQPSPPSSNPSRAQWIALAIILAVAAFLRFDHISDFSLWMDEIWSIELSLGHGSTHDHLPVGQIQTQQLDLTNPALGGSWWSVWTHLDGVPYPPLYHVLLHLWMNVFGNGPAATRGLSALFSLAAILVLFDIARLLHGPRMALLACALMALSGSQLDFAQEARCYPMLIFLGLCAADALVRIERRGASAARLIVLACAVAAMELTHYFALGAILALFIYAMLRLGRRERLKTLAAFVSAGIVAAALWGPWLIEQTRSLPGQTPTFLLATDAQPLRALCLRLIGLPGILLCGRQAAADMNTGIVLAIAALVGLVPLLRLSRRPDLLLWVLWLVGNLGFLAAMDLARKAHFTAYERYAMLASPAVYGLIGAFDWPRRKLWRNGLGVTAILVLALLASWRVAYGPHAKEDWRNLAHQLETNAGPHELMVFYNTDPWMTAGTWYVNFRYYAPQSHRPWLILDRPADPALLEKLRSYPSLWFVGPNAAVAPAILAGWMPQSKLHTQTVGEAAHLYRFAAILRRN